MSNILGAIGRALSNAVSNAAKNIGNKSPSSTKKTSSSSDYSNKHGYDANSNTWGLNNPNQTYTQQQKAQQDYYNNTPDGRAEKEKKDKQKEHKDYIENNGGFDNYYVTQQQKYNDAIRTGDSDTLARLEADSQRVGYTLVPGGGNSFNSGGGGYSPTAQVQQQLQQPMFDVEAFVRQMQEQSLLQSQEMQNYYNQQMQSFQNQMQEQEQNRLKAEEMNRIKTEQSNAYQRQNQQGLLGNVSGVVGGMNNQWYNQQSYNQQNQIQPQNTGAQIKINNSGQAGAVSRYLAQDIWKDK